MRTLRSLLERLESIDDRFAVSAGAPSIEIGADGELRRREFSGGRGAVFTKRVRNNETKRVRNNETKRVPINETKRVPINETKRVPINETKRVPINVTKRVPINETKRVSLAELVRLRDDPSGIAGLLDRALGASGNAYLVIPISLDDADE